MKRITFLLMALGAALLCTVSCEKNKKGYDGNPVSLGLSVRWAEMNVGAIEGDLDGVSVTLADAIDYAAQNKKWSIPTVMQALSWDATAVTSRLLHRTGILLWVLPSGMSHTSNLSRQVTALPAR